MFELTKKSVLRTAIFFLIIMVVYPLICFIAAKLMLHSAFSYNMSDVKACMNISFAYFAVESFANFLTVFGGKNAKKSTF